MKPLHPIEEKNLQNIRSLRKRPHIIHGNVEQMKTQKNYYENIFQKDMTSRMYLKNTSSKSLTSITRDLENVLDIKHHMKSTMQLCYNLLDNSGPIKKSPFIGPYFQMVGTVGLEPTRD